MSKQVRLPMCVWSIVRIRAKLKRVTRRLKTSDRPPCQPGDTLVLTCTWGVDWVMDKMPPRAMIDPAWFWSLWSDKRPATQGRTRQARFVPKVLYRRFPHTPCLSVRSERLHDITEDDAQLEGCSNIQGDTARQEYQRVWDTLQPGHPWATNPEVWRIEFAPVKGVSC